MPPLCLPHLALLLSKNCDPSLGASALAFASALFARIAENMERYSLKLDALRRGSVTKDESEAYGMGLSHLVGEKHLCFPWHIEDIV